MAVHSLRQRERQINSAKRKVYQGVLMDKDLKPKFDFDEVEKWLARVILLLVGLLILLCIIKKVLIHYGFLVSFEHVFVSVANIVAAWAWPCCVLIVIYLFKDCLGELSEALGRIHKGSIPDIKPDLNEEEIEDAEKNLERERSVGAQPQVIKTSGQTKSEGADTQSRHHRSPMDALNEYLKDIVLFKSYALNCLQREKQILISRHVRLFNAGDFDGAYRVRDTTYGVRVKWKPTLDVIERELANLERFYRSLTDSQKSVFKAILCFNSGAVDIDSINQSYERLKCTVPIEPFECRFNPNKLTSNITIVR